MSLTNAQAALIAASNVYSAAASRGAAMPPIDHLVRQYKGIIDQLDNEGMVAAEIAKKGTVSDRVRRLEEMAGIE